jgi:predicted DNA-binding WGR domain protein
LRLASSDKDFENLLEEEYQRQEEGQFVGLFVKNLENVQGDERDFIIMSVCYGHDHNKRMIMNFGPINRKGGEKRLNVIFSRAKKHMAIITSIKYADIKNEHNEGANYFRKFLQYAESVSLGNPISANLTLDSLSKKNLVDSTVNSSNAIVLGIATELNSLGYKTDLNVGQSYFRCNIGVRSNEDENKYCLGVLVDTIDHYKNKNILEQYVLRPAILKGFNWNIIQVYSKDWLHQPEKVMDQILRALKGKNDQIEPLIISAEPIEKLSEKKANDTIETKIREENKITEETKNEKVSESDLDFRRFYFKDETSDKFWEIAQDGVRMIVRYGKTGTKGQENVKVFESEQQTKMEIEKIILQKKKKGYQPI